jgi:hypothetical protein
MRARLRHRIAVLVTAIAVALVVPVAGPGTALADGGTQSCPSGTNWDNFLKRCV